MKKDVDQLVHAGYKLTHGDTNQIDELLKSNNFIYPRDQTVCALSHLRPQRIDHCLQGNVIGSKPFQHPVIIAVMSQQWFKSKSGLGRIHANLLEIHNKPKLPVAMPALAATVVSLICLSNYVFSTLL
jgi:Domain of unknown function (DUF6532)